MKVTLTVAVAVALVTLAAPAAAQYSVNVRPQLTVGLSAAAVPNIENPLRHRLEPDAFIAGSFRAEWAGAYFALATDRGNRIAIGTAVHLGSDMWIVRPSLRAGAMLSGVDGKGRPLDENQWIPTAGIGINAGARYGYSGSLELARLPQSGLAALVRVGVYVRF